MGGHDDSFALESQLFLAYLHVGSDQKDDVG